DLITFLRGDDGADGQDGVDGADGADGQDGADGRSALELLIAVGELPADATVDDFIEYLRGDDGINGADGVDGQDGADGRSALELLIEVGALPENATVDDFIEYLRGDDGADGVDGVDGQDGIDGDNVPFVNILEGDDALITGSDLLETGSIAVAIALTDDAQVDDILTVNGIDTVITQDMIDNGFITSVDIPAQGQTLFVRATITYQDGTQSGTGKDFARVGDTEAPILTVDAIDNGPDEDGNGEPDSTTITGTTEAGAIVGVDINGDGRADFVTLADALGNFSVTIEPALDEGQQVDVTATDAADNTSEPQVVIGLGDTIAPTNPTITAPPPNGLNGTYSEEDLNADGTVTVLVEVPNDAQLGDTLIVNDQEILITRKILFTGYSLNVDPGDRVTASIRDKAGNESGTVIADISVDSTAPLNAPVITDNVANDGSGDLLDPPEIIADFGITNDNTPGVIVPTDQVANGTPQLVVDGEVVASTSVPNGDGSVTLTPSQPLADGEHDLTYNIRDSANNVSGNAPVETIIVDTTAPGGEDGAAQPLPVVIIPEAAGGVNATEFADGIQTQVTLPTGTLVGDIVTLTITPEIGTAITVDYVVTANDLDVNGGNGTADITIPNGAGGISINGAYSVVATVADAAGNVSAPSVAVDFDLNADFIARDDLDDLDLGALQVTYYGPVSGSDLDILGVGEGTGGVDSSLNFTVNAGASGTVSIEVSQTALVAVADAINIEVYNSNGDLVYVGTTGDDPLIGDVLGFELLGLTGNDTLTATVSGLTPDNYTVVVRNDRSTLETLIDDITLEELGDAGVVLGPDNQEAVLDAVEAALNDTLGLGSDLGLGLGLNLGLDLSLGVGTLVRGILETTLDLTTDIGAGELVGLLQESAVLNTLLGGVIDPVVDALAEALLSNTLTLLQTTDITATVTEFDYADDTVIEGNVINPDPLVVGEPGEDDVLGGVLIDIDSNNTGSEPTSQTVGNVTTFTIQGQYGVLVIDSNGGYTYTANGDFASSGQTDTFTYTVSDGDVSDTAELVINLDAVVDTTPPDTPTIDVPIAGDNVVNATEAAASFAVTGTGVSGDTITLTDGSNNILGTAIVDALGNWSINVDEAEVRAMGEGAEQLSATATDPAGNVSIIAATATITVDTTVPVAFDNDVALDIGFQTSTTNVALKSTTVGGLLNLGLLADTVEVSALSSSNVLSFNVAENTTRQVTVDGRGSALANLSVSGDRDFDLVVYKDNGDGSATLVQTTEDWLVYKAGIGFLAPSWSAADLVLPEFEGGGTYYVTLGNDGGLLDVSLLSGLRLETKSDVITNYTPPATVNASAGGNVITDIGDDGADVITAGTIVSVVDGIGVTTGTQITGDYGVLTINQDGSYTYVANTDFTGTFGDVDRFEYTITAPNGEISIANLDITLDYNTDSGAFAARSVILDDTFTLGIDDAIELPDTSLTTSSEGFEILSFEGADQVISLSDMMQPDIIDISGIGANTLNVAAKDINSAIYVRGDSDDTVDLEGDSWSSVGQTVSEGEIYDVWQSGVDTSTQIYIDTDIVNII
ncbi:Ig-like domain-containing protein, partial [Psychrobacter sp. Arc29]|uniref:beta strand repeat-containing protein n=1 Tax=Psychrobacter sp. Arc29 TaxID=3046690 RepID=UPI00352DE4A0